jgi:TPP-dependent indolepyruvate ferredoxin oxidoreductase alpha subunit
MESQSSAVETKKKDKEILISIVDEMAESMTGEQSTEGFIHQHASVHSGGQWDGK